MDSNSYTLVNNDNESSYYESLKSSENSSEISSSEISSSEISINSFSTKNSNLLKNKKNKKIRIKINPNTNNDVNIEISDYIKVTLQKN